MKLKNLLLILLALMIVGCASEEDDETIVATSTTPEVSSVSPGDGDASVSVSTSLLMTFSETMSAATLTTNSGEATCTGAVQLSADDFSSCVGLDASVDASDDALSFTAKPSADLSGATTYKLKITTDAQSEAAVALASEYLMSSGFITASGPALSSSVPADGATGVTDATLTMTFDKELDSSTVTGNTTDTTCSGSFQVSFDSFATCLKFTAQPTLSSDKKTVTLPINGDDVSSTNGAMKATTALKATNGSPLAADKTVTFTVVVNDNSGSSTTTTYKALDFDGSTEYLANSTAKTFGLANTYSIAMWMKIRSFPGNTQYMLSLSPFYEANSINMAVNSSGQLVVYLYDQASGSTFKQYTSSIPLTLDAKSHVALTWNGTNLLLYVNGNHDSAATATVDMTVSPQTDANKTLRLGADFYDGNLFSGQIHSVGMWSSVLGAAEITTLYNAGVPSPDLLNNTGDYASNGSLKHWFRLGFNNSVSVDENGSPTTAVGLDGGTNITTADILDF